MKKYVCTVCGYIYDEAAGIPDQNIPAGTKWEDLPEDWVCPLCGATKSEFETQSSEESPVKTEDQAEEAHESHTEDQGEEAHEYHELSAAELSAICSNLSKGCEKQYKAEEAGLFRQMAEYFRSKSGSPEKKHFNDLNILIRDNLNYGYPQANRVAAEESDRGALRALAWGEKVTKILYSILGRYEKEKDALLQNTKIYVCEICGFVYIGNELPVVCPVCKVPNFKFKEIQRG